MVAFFILLAITIFAATSLYASLREYHLIESTEQWFWVIILPVLAIVFLRIILLKVRGYATKLQDRIIRQEVNFRHYLATGKELNPALTTKQVIALRFAGDSEFVSLCEKAAHDGLSNKQIKEMITDRKGDYMRV